MRLSELFSRAGLECPEEAKNINVKNIVTDSRRAGKDSLFVCVKGLHTDGHDHIDSAIRAGASVIFCLITQGVWLRCSITLCTESLSKSLK